MFYFKKGKTDIMETIWGRFQLCVDRNGEQVESLK